MVDIFRASEHVLPVVQEALTLTPQAAGDLDAAHRAQRRRPRGSPKQAGLKVVMNRCPKIEYGRLSSEISWIGVNSRTLSSKRAQRLGKGVQRMALGPQKGEENGG